MNQLNFDREIDELYKKYLKHCIDNDETPIPDTFVKLVQNTTMSYIAQRVADYALHSSPEGMDRLYVAYRTKDRPHPMADVVVMQCNQCGEDVFIDPGMQHVLEQSKAVICNVCIPEIVGVTIEDIYRQAMGGGDGSV